MTHAKSSITKLMHYIYIVAAIVVAMVLQGGMTVNAEEVVPEGAYDPATYKPETYTVKKVSNSENLSSEATRWSNYIENHYFCCGDKIIFEETDQTKEGYKHLFYIPDNECGHNFQALIDMGIINVVTTGESENGTILQSIEFVDKTKIVKLKQGTGSSGDGPGENGGYYSRYIDSVEPDFILSTSIAIDWDASEIPEEAGKPDLSTLDLPKEFYPMVIPGKSYKVEFDMPILKGYVGDTFNLENFSMSSFVYGAFKNPVLEQMDFFDADTHKRGGFEVKYNVLSAANRYNYDETYEDYYDNHGTELKCENGKYRYPVISKAKFSIRYTNKVLNQEVVTFTYHGEGGKVNGQDEYTIFFSKSNLTDGTNTIHIEEDNYDACYNLIYDVIAELAGEAKRDGYELAGWAHKDINAPIIPYNKKAVSTGLFQSTYFFMEDRATGNADFYAIWKKAGEKTEYSKTDDKKDTQTDTKSDAKKTTNNVKAPKVGAKKNDSSGNATYKVTKVSKNKKGKTVIEVAYVAPTAKTKKKTTIKIPSSVKLADGNTATVKSVASKAFIKNKKITKVVVPSTVTTIGKNAFANCTKLKTVTIKGTTLTKIETGAFQGCTSLKSFTIGKNVKSIGTNAFKNCKNLKKITVNTVKLKKTTVGKRAFKNISKKATFYVPKTITKKKLKNFNAGIQNGNAPKTVKVKKK